MQIENFLQPDLEFGFVTAITLSMFSIIIYLIKKGEKRQEKNEERYEKLVDKLFETIKNMSDRQEKSHKDLTNQINIITTELRLIGMKIEDNTKVIDNELEVRNKFMIFTREDKEKRERFI